MDSVQAPTDIGEVLVMVTNGGPHSPDDWAAVTTSTIMGLIEILPTTPLQIRNKVERFESNLNGLARETHDRMARRERSALAANGAAHLSERIDPSDLATQALAAVLGFAGESVLRDHFARKDVQAIVYQTFGQHLADNAHVERRWFCDNNSGDPAAQAYLDRFDTEGTAVSAGTAQLLAINPFSD